MSTTFDARKKSVLAAACRRHFSCSWPIKDFGKLNFSVGECFVSRVFYSGSASSETWCARVYPGGKKFFDGGYVSFGLSSSDFQSSRMDLSVTLKGATGEIICTDAKVFNEYACEYTLHRVIERKSLLRKLRDDTLVFVVHAEYSGSRGKASCGTTDAGCQTKFVEDMKRLLNSGKNADAVIFVGGYDFPVHVAILSARSRVFEAMFEHETTEKTTRRVTITDFDADTVNSMLQFVYCGNVSELDVDVALDLLRAADKYDIPDLKTLCSNYVIAHLCLENVAHALFVADACEATKLRESAIKYFCANKASFDFENNEYLKERNDLLWDIIKNL